MRHDAFRGATTQLRFEQILRYLHCANNQYADSDLLFKVRSLMQTAASAWKHHYRCGPFAAVDESIIACRGMLPSSPYGT